jgi:hypothetical protein
MMVNRLGSRTVADSGAQAGSDAASFRSRFEPARHDPPEKVAAGES